MIKDLNSYVKYVEFMTAYEDELYALYTEQPDKWQKIKSQLKNKQYDVESDDCIFLAGMEAIEFYVKVSEDDKYVAEHPLLSELAKIEIEDDE